MSDWQPMAAYVTELAFTHDVNKTGVFWQWDRARPMGDEEYTYWMERPLPFGCAIISAPLPAPPQEDR